MHSTGSNGYLANSRDMTLTRCARLLFLRLCARQVFTSSLARSYSSRHPRRRGWCRRIRYDGYLDFDEPPASVEYSCGTLKGGL